MVKEKHVHKSKPSIEPQGATGSGSDGDASSPGPVSMKLLGPLVFSCGAAIMAIEIVGVRLLAPHFGVSVYVWGSILTVFMAALACGYWAGGRVADAHPSFRLLNVIVMMGAATIIAVPYLAPIVSKPLEGLGERWGPLCSSMVLFFVPSMFLATVSPFAVRLVATELDTVGGAAGRLYALSTVGSIFGSWLTTFVLIGFMPLTHILLTCTAVVAILATINLLVTTRGRAVIGGTVGILLACSVFLPEAMGSWDPAAEGEVIRDQADTPYHRILITESPEGALNFYDSPDPMINMRFDRFKESGIFDVPPYRTTSRYTDAFHLAGSLISKPKSAVFIGAGGGLGPRTFRERWPDMRIDIVDIDPKVIEFCEQYFHLRADFDPEDPTGGDPDPLMTCYAQDGRRFIRDRPASVEPDAPGPKGGYDFVVLDAFTIGGRIPWHLVTREFFSEIRDSLSPKGLLVMNTIGALGPPQKKGKADMSVITHSIYKSMAAAFGEGEGYERAGYVYVFPVNFGPAYERDPGMARNVILVASNWGTPLPQAEISRLTAEFDELGILGKPIASMVADLLTAKETDAWLAVEDRAPLFTDQYCPVETMAFYGDEDE